MEPIAIVGMGCRFPQARNLQEYWNLLVQGKDAIQPVPEQRWDIDHFYDPTPGTPGKMSTRWGGFLEKVDEFDADFFGIAPREVIYMDPQQRLLLEVAWEALEHAGAVPEQLAQKSVGVFVGISTSDYHQQLNIAPTAINAYLGTGNAFSIAANRLSYLFDFRGPSLAIDTACSSSLVAVHLACQSLRSGESQLALAGGVNLMLSPELTLVFSQARMMAADGRCKTFDARADGYVRGEGCGVVVLKRLTDAQAAGDRITAIIRSTAINQDGRSNGLTAPNGLAQIQVIQQAQAQAGVRADQISYVELHGTGTALGDPIEAEALGQTVGRGRQPGQACRVGSVKTNIGHLEAAAGIAGMIKVALALQHHQLPPSLHFERANPYIRLDSWGLQVQQTLEDWPPTRQPLMAGVSSFGFGGTNAHGILQEAPPVATAPSQADRLEMAYLLPLSARSPESLQALALAYYTWLQAAPNSAPSLQDLGYNTSRHRHHHDYRLAIACTSAQDLLAGLATAAQGEAGGELVMGRKPPGRLPKIVFVFSGQGPQWWAMGRELLLQNRLFRQTVETCDRLFQTHSQWSLLEALLADEDQSHLQETAIAQPTLFALQVGLSTLWQHWGVAPDAVVGHSAGEVAAAYTAGALSLEDAVKVVYYRGQIMQQATGLGKMALVGLTPATALERIALYGDQLAIAAINSPDSVVISGQAEALLLLLADLESEGVFCKRMRVNYAFHSPQMAPFQADLVAALADLSPRSTRIPFYSTIVGDRLEGMALNADYWGRSIRDQVQFASAISALAKKRHRTFLEVGPHPVLTTNILQCLRHSDSQGVALASLRRHEPEHLTLGKTLGQLYCAGYPVDWATLYPQGQRLDLPTYPWQRQRYWVGQAQEVLTESSTSNGNCHDSNGTSPFQTEWTLTKADLLSFPEGERQAVLEQHFSRLLATTLGFVAAKLDVQKPLYTLGMDSLMAVELKNWLESTLEITIPLEYFSVLSVAQFVEQVLAQVEGAVPVATPAPAAEPGPTLDTGGLEERKRWIKYPQLRPQAPWKLFCFPHAGGGASFYRRWQTALPDHLELCLVQPPGREERLSDEPFTRLSGLVESLLPQLIPEFDRPFLFFGHSLGGLVAFELTRALQRQQRPIPEHLFISACRAPQIPDLNPPIHRLPDDKFIARLRQFNGTPEAVLNRPDFMQQILPGLRADFAILETYFYASSAPLPCSISVFGGEHDPQASKADLEAWEHQTQNLFQLRLWPGDHFFLIEQYPALLEIVARSLDRVSVVS